MKLGPFPTNAEWGSSAIQIWLDRLRSYYSIFLAHIGVGGVAQHPVFTTTDAGFAPASGAAVGHFLRDDGTWVASGGGGQTSIQFKDEGINIGGLGLIDSANFVGAGVVATVAGTALTVTIAGGSSGGASIDDMLALEALL